MMDTPRLVVGIILLIVILSSPDNSNTIPSRDYSIRDLITEERRWLGTLQNSTYGDVGNLTGFVDSGWWSTSGMGLVRTLVSDMVDDVFKRTTRDETLVPRPIETDLPVKRAVEEDVNTTAAFQDTQLAKDQTTTSTLNQVSYSLSEAPIYRNITGILSGDWQRLTLPDLYKPVINQTYERNVTYDRGQFWLTVKERKPGKYWEDLKGLAQLVSMHMQLHNGAGGDEKDVRMYGIHFVESGLIVGVSSSDKFAGLFGLPHLTPSYNTYELVKKPLNSSLSDYIDEHETSGEEWPPWTPSDEQFLGTPPVRCEYITYLQVHPIKLRPTDSPFAESSQQVVIDTIERELRQRTGEYIPIAPPPLIGSVIVYSPDCSFVLSASPAVGMKLESYYLQVCKFGLVASALIALEIFFMIRQMNESSTPSTLSRVSFWSIGIISLLDGYAVIVFVVAATLMERCALPLITAGFFCAVFAGFFGLRYMLMIYRVQLPERRAAIQTTPSQPSPAVAAALAASQRATASGTLPLPVTAQAQTQTTNTTTPTTTTRQDFSSIITRFYMFLVITGFLMVYSISLPVIIRNFIQRIALLLSLSFWIPQIYRNTYRNCRKGLKWEFVFGISCCRLVFVLYFYGYPDNVLFLRPERWICWSAAGWVWCQIWILGVQELLGPRFLIPDGVLPPAYDYHPILPLDDLERALSNQTSPTSPSSADNTLASSIIKPQTHKTFDCAICMQSVEIPVAPSSAAATTSVSAGNTNSDRRTGNGGGSMVGGLLGQGMYVGRRGYMVTPCRHVFHSGCLEGWMRVRLQCPICRNALPPI